VIRVYDKVCGRASKKSESRGVTAAPHSHEIRLRKVRRGFDLMSDVLPFGRLWYGGPNAVSNAIGFAVHHSRSRGAVIRVYDQVANLIEMHEHAGNFKEP
jgi:hypothetical protein